MTVIHNIIYGSQRPWSSSTNHRDVRSTTAATTRLGRGEQRPVTATTTTSFTEVFTTNSAPNRILACSAAGPGNNVGLLLQDSRVLCEDRKGLFDHLKFGEVARSVLKVGAMLASQTFSHYFNDSFKEDLARDNLVRTGKMTVEEADQEQEEWNTQEWKRRWEDFPEKFLRALAKHHAIVLVMRFYEMIAARYVDAVTLDKLTTDTFEYAKRAGKHAVRRKERGKATGSRLERATDMTRTCFYSYLIGFIADYSVHQVILAFGYYVYVREQRKRRKQQRQQQKQKQQHPPSSETEDDDQLVREGGSIAMSLMKKSVLLAISRGVTLVTCSIGGGIGFVVYPWPGWGMMGGSNLGDAAGAAMTAELVEDAPCLV